MKHIARTILLTLFVVASVLAQQVNSDIQNIGTRDINRGALRVVAPNLEQEAAMGRQAAAELEKNVKFNNDPVLWEYVNRVVQNIVRNSDAKTTFTVRVIDSAEINAMAFPGGFFFVNTGLIVEADNESQFAAAIAHQIAHVTARHAAEQAGKASMMTIASLPLTTSNSGIAGKAIQDAAQLGIPLGFLAFSRANEMEADYLGLQYLYKAGYAPASMTAAATKLSDEVSNGKNVPAIFSTHPPTSDRIEQIRKVISEILPARAQSITNTAEFDAIKARLKN